MLKPTEVFGLSESDKSKAAEMETAIDLHLVNAAEGEDTTVKIDRAKLSKSLMGKAKGICPLKTKAKHDKARAIFMLGSN